MNVKEVQLILDRYSTAPKKKFGQNFLMDNNIIKKIVQTANINKNINVIEIGPGLGFLTKELSKNAKKVLCYEIDPDMVNCIKDTFGSDSNVVVKQADFLKVNVEKDIKENFDGGDVVITANLPYYITTAILTKVLEEAPSIKGITVMMQQEVAQRLCGKPSTKDYNGLSVLIQYYTTPKIALKVPANCFYPAPNVDSSVIHLTFKNEIINKAINEDYFKKFIRAIFTQRRKTINNNLKTVLGYKSTFIEKCCNLANISISSRADGLTVDQIVNLSNCFYNNLEIK